MPLTEPRTLHVISAPQRRGAEQVAWALVDRLRSMGVPSELVALEPSYNQSSDLPVASIAGGCGFPGVVARLARRARCADVVVSHGGSTLLPSVLAGRITGRPVLYRNIGDPAYWAPRGLRLRALGLVFRRTAGIVALYPEAARWIGEEYHISSTRITVIPSPSDSDRFPMATTAMRTRARSDLGLPPEVPVLAYVGALSGEKRPDIALRVASMLPEAHLVVAGDGPLRDDVAAMAAPLGDRVLLLGQLNDVRPVYAASDALLLPSETEGVPGVVLESILSGTPVVASAVGAVPRLLEGGLGEAVPNEPALLVSACRRVLGAPPITRRVRDRIADDHSMDRVAGQWIEALRRVHGRSPIGLTTTG